MLSYEMRRPRRLIMVGTASRRLLLLFVFCTSVSCAVAGSRGNDLFRDNGNEGGYHGDDTAGSGDDASTGGASWNRAWVPDAAPRRRVLISIGKDADHPDGIVKTKAAHDEGGTGAPVRRRLTAEDLPDGCEASICPATPAQHLGSVCVFGRLHPEAPAFVVPLNPKSGSSTVRNGFARHHGTGLTFEASCGLYQPLRSRLAKRLNVTGWPDVAMAVVVREPMSRFVSAWNEITLRASMQVLHRERPGHTATRGFMWMHDEVRETLVSRGGNKRKTDQSALEALRTPEYFRRFQEHYLQFVESINAPISWDQDIHLSPQAAFMGVCSPQSLRARVLIQMERVHDEMPEFLSKYAGATEAQDKALLDYFRAPPHWRKSSRPGLLDVKKLREESVEHADLWRRIQGSVNMRTDYLCTGYPVPHDATTTAKGRAPLNGSTITKSKSNNIQRRGKSHRHSRFPLA